jgi:hypothetical protein
MKTFPIPAVCSMKGCSGAPIAAMKVDGVWVSQCLRHSKGHGKIDPEKVQAPPARQLRAS